MSKPYTLQHKILLASESPRRRELLESMGFATRVVKVDVEEDYPTSMPYREIPGFLAKKKAHATIPYMNKGEIVLAGDSIVVCDEDLLEKPNSREEARAMLLKLSGGSHLVMTGVCLLSAEQERSATSITRVHFAPFALEEIDYYLDCFQPYDKAGSYGIQEWIGWCKVEKIEGSYSNVMGLPTALIYLILNRYFQRVISE